MLSQKSMAQVTQAAEEITNLFDNRSCMIGLDCDQTNGPLTVGIFVGDDLIGCASPILPPEFFPDFKGNGVDPALDHSSNDPYDVEGIRDSLFQAFCEKVNRHLVPYTLRLQIKETKDQLVSDLSQVYQACRTLREALVAFEVTPVISWKNKLQPTEFEDSIPLKNLLTDAEFDRLVAIGASQQAKQSAAAGFGFVTGGHISP